MKKRHYIDFDCIKKLIEESLYNKNCLLVKVDGLCERAVFPRKIFYIEGKRVLIYEDTDLKSLDFLKIDNVEFATISDKFYYPNFSDIEIKQFLEKIRFFSNVEQRVILKVSSSGKMKSYPQDQLFQNTFMTSRPNSYNIWGSTVEVSKGFFDWLYLIKEDVSILYPISLKTDFIQYCEKRFQDT